jgi:cyclomaltodextrinase
VPGRTLYHLHSLRAADGGGLAALEGWLDHVAALGCGGVLLTPIHESSNHGYDTIDPFRVDPRLGDDADVDRFVAACRERDLRLVLDGVFNHVGRAFVPPPSSDDWFRRNADGSARGWEGHDELLELDHGNAAVLDWAVRVGRHWLDRGADGWRLDVAYSIPRPFLASFAAQLRETHPEVFLFGEMIHGDYARFVEESGLDSATAYELHKAIWSSLHDRNPHELAWALQRFAEAAASFAPVTFVGNHDVTRLASCVADAAVQVPVAAAVLLTLPGVPCVYYGDELGATGVKVHGAGGDDAIRPPLSSLDRSSAGELQRVHRELIGWRRARPWLTTATVTLDEVTNAGLRYTVQGAGERVRVAVRPDGYDLD